MLNHIETYLSIYLSTYAQTLILVNAMVVNCFGLFNFIRNAFPLLYNLWTQDGPIFPLTFEDEMGPYIDQGRSTTKV